MAVAARDSFVGLDPRRLVHLQGLRLFYGVTVDAWIADIIESAMAFLSVNFDSADWLQFFSDAVGRYNSAHCLRLRIIGSLRLVYSHVDRLHRCHQYLREFSLALALEVGF